MKNTISTFDLTVGSLCYQIDELKEQVEFWRNLPDRIPEALNYTEKIRTEYFDAISRKCEDREIIFLLDDNVVFDYLHSVADCFRLGAMQSDKVRTIEYLKVAEVPFFEYCNLDTLYLTVEMNNQLNRLPPPSFFQAYLKYVLIRLEEANQRYSIYRRSFFSDARMDFL